MGPRSGDELGELERATAEYRAAAARDPRRFCFGYLAGDPASGARAPFLWFATLEAMLDFLCRVEVRLLQFGEADATRIAGSLRREAARAQDVARLDRGGLSGSFEGWCEILWIGVFRDLRERGGPVPTSLRAAFRHGFGAGRDAGPIADGEMERFVEYLRALGSDLPVCGPDDASGGPEDRGDP